MKQQRFVIDGEICVLDLQGISQLDWLHSGRRNEEAQLYAFDILALDGDDLRRLPLCERKEKLAKILQRRPEGIFVAPFERGEIGRACSMRRVVSALRVWSPSTARYRPRTCDWVKVKNWATSRLQPLNGPVLRPQPGSSLVGRRFCPLNRPPVEPFRSRRSAGSREQHQKKRPRCFVSGGGSASLPS